MAEGILGHLVGGHFESFSAGTEAAHGRPEAIEAMREVGVDISGLRSEMLDRYLGEHFDYVVTVCDDENEACPVSSPGRRDGAAVIVSRPVRGGGKGEAAGVPGGAR